MNIIPASDPNGKFATSLDSNLFGLLGLSSLQTSWAVVSEDFWGFHLLGLLGLASLRASWAFVS